MAIELTPEQEARVQRAVEANAVSRDATNKWAAALEVLTHEELKVYWERMKQERVK